MSVLSGKRILVVEDEFVIAAMVVDMLEDNGAVVVGPAPTLEAALRSARETELDAAVLDINVGGRRSDPVAEALSGRGVPLVFATGYGEGAWAGAADAPVLTKPFTERALVAALSRVLKGA
jgi:DNA-binding response OmpR family regulator